MQKIQNMLTQWSTQNQQIHGPPSNLTRKEPNGQESTEPPCPSSNHGNTERNLDDSIGQIFGSESGAHASSIPNDTHSAGHLVEGSLSTRCICFIDGRTSTTNIEDQFTQPVCLTYDTGEVDRVESDSDGDVLYDIQAQFSEETIVNSSDDTVSDDITRISRPKPTIGGTDVPFNPTDSQVIESNVQPDHTTGSLAIARHTGLSPGMSVQPPIASHGDQNRTMVASTTNQVLCRESTPVCESSSNSFIRSIISTGQSYMEMSTPQGIDNFTETNLTLKRWPHDQAQVPPPHPNVMADNEMQLSISETCETEGVVGGRDDGSFLTVIGIHQSRGMFQPSNDIFSLSTHHLTSVSPISASPTPTTSEDEEAPELPYLTTSSHFT